ncbi:carboxypeptidase regulatory-like domain-containing protein [Thiohalobacter sp.]|uniref:carboxypeptidase regulatory-like domain-containing protein n=1 Tax=Thiohalobacter sp. TaxID=2025948 RepID=UPI002614AA66|nr:carboxypeptidase regulatory-like domain-containing protein [Thiohalobacter sp.]
MPHRAWALGLLFAWSAIQAAEIRGRVDWASHEGVAPRLADPRIGVTLLAGPDGPVTSAASREHLLRVVDGRFQPAYLVVQRGDRIRFRNEDPVHHLLFWEPEDTEIRLAPPQRDGLAAELSRPLAHPGIYHLFCRIHSRNHARIDVLESGETRLLEPGGRFEFRGLRPGQWKLRIAAPGAETREIDALAMTAPPPLAIVLQRRMLQRRGPAGLPVVAVEQLYPARPGY